MIVQIIGWFAIVIAIGFAIRFWNNDDEAKDMSVVLLAALLAVICFK